jgi:hypothetical protein
MRYFIHRVSACALLVFSPHLVSCPTCVGMPQAGSRPYFERHGIQYKIPHYAPPTFPNSPVPMPPNKREEPKQEEKP